MSTATTATRRRLGARQFIHVPARQPVRVRADSGSLWITVDGEKDDIQLDAPACREFDGHAPVTVGTMQGDALLTLTPLRERGWLPRLLQGLADWRAGFARA